MRHRNLIFVLAVGFSPFTMVVAAPADIPQTGQTLCHSTAGDAMDCAGTGQDGELRAGVAWPSPRFVVGSGAEADCVTDNLTGLMWVRSPSPTLFTWAGALTSANSLTLCGFSDWRLPNVHELESLVNAGSNFVAVNYLNAQGFSNVLGAPYWTSTTYAGDTTAAWRVGLDAGAVEVFDKVGNNYVLPVRAGL